MKIVLRMFSFGFFLVFLLALVSSGSAQFAEEFPCDDVIGISSVECQALVALYNSTNGSEWIQNNNWLVTTTPADWYGVTVVDGYVTQIDLRANRLTGFIPSDLGSLTHLTHLDLSINQLSGGIPVGLGSLVQLSRLYLYDNSLSGPIPASLGNLTDMWSLWLSGNQLTGSIPEDLGMLTNLAWLRLADNQLSGAIPPQLGALTGLAMLSLGNNQLTGEIPEAIGGMTSLQILLLANNQISGSIPSALGNLTNLSELDLSSNQLSGSIPPGLGSLTNLYILYLNDNLFSGEIPDITSLVYLLPPDDPDGPGLDLDYNALTVPFDYVNETNPLHVFLSQYDPDWHTLQAFQQIIGTAGGTLTALDGRTSFLVPSDALNDYTIFTFTPLPAPDHASGELVFANNSFRLTAVDMLGAPVTSFNQPFIAMLSYADTDVLHTPETSLALYAWNIGTEAWLDAITTCGSGAYTRDLAANTLTLPVCSLSDFSLFGVPYLHRYLPIIRKT